MAVGGIGRLGEASLPRKALPSLGVRFDSAHRQQALARNTLVGHNTEQLAGWQAGILHEQLEVITRGKILTQFPPADGSDGEAQVLGDSFEGNLVLLPPVAEGACKASAYVALKLRILGHGGSLEGIGGGSKEAIEATGLALLFLPPVTLMHTRCEDGSRSGPLERSETDLPLSVVKQWL